MRVVDLSRPNVEILAERVQSLIEVRNHEPANRAAREQLAVALLEYWPPVSPIGTIDRGRHLLHLIAESFPIPALQAAYFENLECFLQRLPRRQNPGRVVLGLGSGRSGSTSLTALLATVDESCCTHENPPLIYWEPENEQIEFHIRRFDLLIWYFALIFDASHWWLPALPAIESRFADMKAIAVVRRQDTCVESFLKLKGSSWGSVNHWVEPGNGIWRANYWDPTYPTYPIPEGAVRDPDSAKRRLIDRYISEYNRELHRLAARKPEQELLIHLEDLSQSDTQHQIFQFIGASGSRMEHSLNVGTMGDGVDQFRF